MKSRPNLILPLALAAIASVAMPVSAQIEGPPEFIDYQGRVLDALGAPVAPFPASENIEMYFRIWDHISDSLIGNLVWAEKQIVTVSDGNFSVRLGEGDPIQSSAGDNVVLPGNDDPRPSLLTVFDGKERFLGVSVAANSLAKPTTEIQPRLAFLTAPFAAVAEKARFAEFGPSTGVFEATQIGVGTSLPGSLIEATGPNLLAANNGSGLISAGAIGGSHIALDADDIQSYSDGSTPAQLNLNGYGGDVKIGSVGALTRIEGEFTVFAGGNGGQFKVFDLPPAGDKQLIAGLDAAFGVNAAQMRFEGDALPIDIGQDSTGNFVVESNNDVARFVVQQGGNVGIGTSIPSDALTIGNSGSFRLNGGDIKPLGTQLDGVRWVDAGGAIQAHLLRYGPQNRLYVTNAGVNNLTGVFLNSGGTAWGTTSDERLKSDIVPVSGILEKIEDVRVVEFNMASLGVDQATGKQRVDRARPPRKTKDGTVIKHDIGTIAQDWIKHFPELVIEPEGEDGYYGLAYDRIGVVAIGAAQELHARLKEQEAQLQARDKKIADLEARLARIEALMSAAK